MYTPLRQGSPERRAGITDGSLNTGRRDVPPAEGRDVAGVAPEPAEEAPPPDDPPDPSEQPAVANATTAKAIAARIAARGIFVPTPRPVVSPPPSADPGEQRRATPRRPPRSLLCQEGHAGEGQAQRIREPRPKAGVGVGGHEIAQVRRVTHVHRAVPARSLLSGLVTRRSPGRAPIDPSRAPIDPGQATAARYVAVLFGLSVALQRFAVPGLTVVELLLPIVLGWAVWGLHRGVLVLDRRRLALWAAAAGACALAVPAQVLAVQDTRISLGSYGLFLVVWLPAVLRLREVGRAGYLLALRRVAGIALVLAGVCIVMTGSQLAGLPYRDWMAEFLPEGLLLQDFIITYPVTYGSSLYRANAWIGLEPSIVSLQLGIGFLAALLTRMRWPALLVLSAGIVCTTAGSGMAIVAVGVLVLLLHKYRSRILRYAPGAVAALAMIWFAPWGVYIYSRLTEFSNPDSSTSLRGVLPYQYLWRFWVDQPAGILLGHGPGSSQDLVTASRIVGLLVPTPAKIFFDYGLVAGLVLACFLIVCYVGGPSRSLAVTLAVSLWLIQPGTTVMVIIVQVFLTVTWWSPRTSPVLESTPTGGHG